MVTKKKLIIPIFEYKLTIIIFDDWGELESYLSKEEFKTPARAITFSQYGASMVMVNAKHGSSIVHEAVHIKNAIWEWIGYRPMADNDEVDAYVVTYIYNKIVDVFYKHNDEKSTIIRG